LETKARTASRQTADQTFGTPSQRPYEAIGGRYAPRLRWQDSVTRAPRSRRTRAVSAGRETARGRGALAAGVLLSSPVAVGDEFDDPAHARTPPAAPCRTGRSRSFAADDYRRRMSRRSEFRTCAERVNAGGFRPLGSRRSGPLTPAPGCRRPRDRARAWRARPSACCFRRWSRSETRSRPANSTPSPRQSSPRFPSRRTAAPAGTAGRADARGRGALGDIQSNDRVAPS
jgi:hypothetical protein